MLKIKVDAVEVFDSRSNIICTINERSLEFEHSLISISRYEAHFKIPFLSDVERTRDKTLYYIGECMPVKTYEDIYSQLTRTVINTVIEYIEDSNTATLINSVADTQKKQSIITSEEIYYYMIKFGIPFETQKWHLNRLLTLIRICNIKENPKKMSQADLYRQNKELNKARRGL